MASINPPVTKPKAKRSLPKKQGKYVIDTAALINVAGEVFVLNTRVNKFYDLSGSYDQALKGDEAFDEFFLSVFDGLATFEYTENNKKISEDLTIPGNIDNLKKRAISIYIKLFGVNPLLLPSPVKIPCDARDFQILLRTLFFRRTKLIDQIADYNNVSRSDMKARYLRDHLQFLNQLIENDIPSKIDCVDVDALIEGRKGPSFGNLTDENILKLLNIFAYLIAQGRDPLQYFLSKNPVPDDVLTKIGLKGAPTLEDYLGQIEIEGEDSNEYVKTEFTPTMKKVRDIIYGTDFTSELIRLEKELNINANPTDSITNRVENIIKAIKDITDKSIAREKKCYADLKDTQDIAYDIIEQLKKEAAVKGSVRGLLQTAVQADIDFRILIQKSFSFANLYNSVESFLQTYNLVSNNPVAINDTIFGDSYIHNIFNEIDTIYKFNSDFYQKILVYLERDAILESRIFTKNVLVNQKRVYTYERFIYQQLAKAYQSKITFDKTIINFYVTENDKLLNTLRSPDFFSKLPTLPDIIKDTKKDLEVKRKEAHTKFTELLKLYNDNVTILISQLQKYNDAANPPNRANSKFAPRTIYPPRSKLGNQMFPRPLPVLINIDEQNSIAKEFNFSLTNLGNIPNNCPSYLNNSVDNALKQIPKKAEINVFNANAPLQHILSANDIFNNPVAAQQRPPVQGQGQQQPAPIPARPSLLDLNNFVSTSDLNRKSILGQLERNLDAIYFEETYNTTGNGARLTDNQVITALPLSIMDTAVPDNQKNILWDSVFNKLKLIQEITWLSLKHRLLQRNIFMMTFFYEKLWFTEQRINAINTILNNQQQPFANIDIAIRKEYLVYITALQTRLACEFFTINNIYDGSFQISEILKSYNPQFGGGGPRDDPIVSPKNIKQMIRQMKNNVLGGGGEIVEENDNLESLMEIYDEQTVDSTLGICSLSMLFLLLEVSLIKNNMYELREAIYSPLQDLQKEKAYEFLQDFFSSFQDLDHSTELTFQLKKETLDIPEKANEQAKELLATMFAIESAPKQYANEFIVFLQVVRTILEENSHILEELGCLIPM